MRREEREREADELLEIAWGIIANASGSDWSREPEAWEKAAITWRAAYFRHLDGAASPSDRGGTDG